MGAPTELCPPSSSARAVATALSDKSAGNPLAYFRLQHALSSKDPSAIAAILSGLTHFATSFPSSDLRVLFDHALRADLLCLCAPSAAADFPALDALLSFAENLASADPSYVQPLLEHFVVRAFAASVDARGPLIKYALRAVAAVLRAHPRAADLLVAVLRKRFPHPVRPAVEHVAFLRASLALARDRRWPAVGRSIVATVMERLGTIEALVPEELTDVDGALVPEAAKVQAVVLEIMAHVDAGAQEAGYATWTLEPLFAAYESAIVPVEATRFSPFVLLYAASRGGEEAVRRTVERLRVGFFDEEMSQRLREKFLQHSSAVVVRSRMVGVRAARGWMEMLARWLNRYVDGVEQTGEGAEVDTDVHFLFYCGCAALMGTVARRTDAVSERGGEGLHGMRMFRLMMCELNPLAVVPGEIVREFARAVGEVGEGSMDFSEILERNKSVYTPTRTRYGARNRLEYAVRWERLGLDEARERMKEYVREEEEEGRRDAGEGKGTVGSPASARAAAVAFSGGDVDMLCVGEGNG